MRAVTIENLSKIYDGGKKAVDNISIGLVPGEIFGFLGPQWCRQNHHCEGTEWHACANRGPVPGF